MKIVLVYDHKYKVGESSLMEAYHYNWWFRLVGPSHAFGIAITYDGKEDLLKKVKQKVSGQYEILEVVEI